MEAQRNLWSPPLSANDRSRAAEPAEAPTRRPDLEWETLRRLLPPYNVILHNDDVNDMVWVIQSLLICVPSLSQDEAFDIMMQAHTHGEALVITCPLEQAELYRERLEGRRLTATIRKC